MSFLQIVWVFWHTLFRFSRAVARVWIVEALWVSDFAIHVSVSCNFLKTIDMYNRTTPFPWPVCCVIARQESKLDLTLEVERVPLLFFIPRRHNRQNLTVNKVFFLYLHTHSTPATAVTTMASSSPQVWRHHTSDGRGGAGGPASTGDAAAVVTARSEVLKLSRIT